MSDGRDSAGVRTEPRVGCAVDADGRITFDLSLPSAEAERPQLLLRLRPKKGRPEQALHVLDLEPAGEGRVRAALGGQPVLAEGRWDVYLLGPGDERQRLRPGLRDLRALVDGHLRDRPSPVAVRIPYVTKDGCLAVRAWLRPAHAEVDGIDVDVAAGSTSVGARLHGTSLLAGAVVRLRLRGSDGAEHTLEPQAGSDGRSFSFTLDHAELAAATERGTGAGSGVWNVFVQPSAKAPVIRLARLLDDVADRKEVFVYPPVTAGGVALCTYYTVDNDLSVEVRR
ncbi:hypothetical protein OOK12_20140 [Streptomyces sp. NBC_00452]|uniref:hypothetical protein n=1 Tax=Streptomyces sp. NBC_00452 TaxID=2975746 RepID=UPI00224FBB21|nr:hypothetical protein [Streptomyces sp. NBC_00452]MCX5059298.1 hypothetical protein [Streptomyces sp. NBC_00452]